MLYRIEDLDITIVKGDLNARIGKHKDFIEDLDEIPEREVLDTNNNRHGVEFIEFLHECRFCVLNGRGLGNQNDYTSVSTKGSAVVDYIAVPINDLKLFSNFKVEACADIVDKLNLHSLVVQAS